MSVIELVVKGVTSLKFRLKRWGGGKDEIS